MAPKTVRPSRQNVGWRLEEAEEKGKTEEEIKDGSVEFSGYAYGQNAKAPREQKPQRACDCDPNSRVVWNNSPKSNGPRPSKTHCYLIRSSHK
jgi:hypothetical protein